MSKHHSSPAREDIGYVTPEEDDFTIKPRFKKIPKKKKEPGNESGWDQASPSHIFACHMEALRQ